MSIEEKRYNLQQLRQELLKINLDDKPYLVLNDFFIRRVYGLFGDDNSFVIAMESSQLEFNFLVSPFDLVFYLIDLLFGSATLVSKNYYLVDYFYRKNNLSNKYDERFVDNDIYKYNGVDYCVILLTKIIPAEYLHNITLSDLGKIQDRINLFLADNPNFVSDVFFSNQGHKNGDKKSVSLKNVKKRNLK